MVLEGERGVVLRVGGSWTAVLHVGGWRWLAGYEVKCKICWKRENLIFANI